jgi:putative CocE/NonD family hydrolase
MHYEVLAWYDHWLKGRETGVMEGPAIRYQIAGDERWHTANEWPPKEAKLTSFFLGADGVLSQADGRSGDRAYLYMPEGSGEPAKANRPGLPDRLVWETTPLGKAMTFAGDVELTLEASITALDTGWIAVLYDVPPEGEPEAITAGWLRARLSSVNEEKSRPGAPVLDCRQPNTIPVGQIVSYRIPLVPNARYLPAGHALRLVIASADTENKSPTVLGFTHSVVREASVNTISSGSRLWLPLMEID